MPKLIRRVIAALVIAALALAAQSPAGNWSSVKGLAPGIYILLAANPSGSIRCKVRSVTDESLVVDTSKGQETFARQDVARVSVRKTNHRKRHALIGLAVGAGAGAAIGAATSASCSGIGCIGAGPKLVAGLTGAGALLGALIGWALPSGGWREIYTK